MNIQILKFLEYVIRGYDSSSKKTKIKKNKAKNAKFP